jgi:hypothetical protein
MEARPAVANDADEIVRLARLMFESMGIDLADATWEEEGRRHVRERVGGERQPTVLERCPPPRC